MIKVADRSEHYPYSEDTVVRHLQFRLELKERELKRNIQSVRATLDSIESGDRNSNFFVSNSQKLAESLQNIQSLSEQIYYVEAALEQFEEEEEDGENTEA